MSATCPVCEREQDEGLLCHACTSTLEYELGDVAAIVAELDITLSRQARVGSGGKGGLASEKTPIHVGALTVADDLTNTLTTWARDVAGDWLARLPVEAVIYRDRDAVTVGPFCEVCWHPSCEAMRITEAIVKPPSIIAAHALLSEVPAIRRHPAVVEMVDEITDAVRQARRVVDRPADRHFLGPCLGEFEGVTCTEDLYARPQAGTARCKVCGWETQVVERRAWLLAQAADRLFTVREAAQMMGDVGGIRVTESSIRGYVHRERIAYRPGKMIRLGDLLAVVVDEGERRSA